MNQQSFTLITGASEGLGKFLAFEFAKRKHALIIVALPASPLLSVANYIRSQFNVDVYPIFADLSTLEGCCELHHKVTEAGLPVNCLVNNAGIGNTNPFAEKSIAFYQRQIGINVLAPTLLSRLFLPGMMKHPNPAILNVSSLTSFFAIPNKQVYCATKSFLLAFSKALNYEMEGTGLQVSVVCPGGMNTRLPIILATKERHGISRWSMMNPEQVAAITVAAFLSGSTLIIPGRWNKLFLAIDRILPPFMKRRIIRKQVSDAETFENSQRSSPIHSMIGWLEAPNAA